MSGGSGSRAYAIGFTGVVLLGVALRFAGVFHDWPYSYYGDELHLMKRSIAMGTGDLNPHWFHKPALLMYLLLGSYGGFFAIGRLVGKFASSAAFGAYFLAEPGPFVAIGRLVVLAFGVATIFVTARLGKRTGGAFGGLAAAFAVAVLLPATAGSQVIKEDVPAGFFVAAAALAYLAGAERRSIAPVVWAGALAGASMATKYYGIILIPGIVVVELLEVLAGRRSWAALFGRSSILVATFVAGFFVASPYNFLDPTWPRTIAARIGVFGGGDVSAEEHFDPDGKVSYEPGLAAIPGASVHFIRQVMDREALTAPLLVLALIGMVSVARRPETRRDAIVLGAPTVVFWLGAVTMAPYHLQARQLNAILPLLCPLLGPGAQAFVGLGRLRGRAATGAAALVTLAACLPTLSASIRNIRDIMRVDSRNVAVAWIEKNISPADRILLDDYGPQLSPNAAAVGRLEERLALFSREEAFTAAQAKRLELLRAYPPHEAFDVQELGHTWWLPREMSDEELRKDWKQRDMGNPLTDRVPKDVATYRAEGFVWIVTNSEAQVRYFSSPEEAQAFPSFHRFYSELRARRPAQTFDPKDWGGKGPVVWIYDLREA